jgi:WD40 repeat protein
LLTTLPGFGSEVRSATFSADNARIVLAGSDGIIRIWNIARQTQSWETLAADACTRLLAGKGRRFTALEIETDPLLSSEWPDAARDVCEGIRGAPTLAEQYQSAEASSAPAD